MAQRQLGYHSMHQCSGKHLCRSFGFHIEKQLFMLESSTVQMDGHVVACSISGLSPGGPEQSLLLNWMTNYMSFCQHK